MKVEISKRCNKSIKKIPVNIQQKYFNLIKDLKKVNSIFSLQKYDPKRLKFNNSIIRLKINNAYRVVLKESNPNTFEVIGVFSREEVYNYQKM